MTLAGFIAPSPTNQGWTLTWTAPSTVLTNSPVSPDGVELLSAPTLICPGNMLACVPDPTNTIAVSWPNPVAVGLPPPVVTCVPPSGSSLSVGVHPATCTATNSAGTNTCAFTVTVNVGVPNVVTTTSDSGCGSLRATIASAVSGATITFDPALNGQTLVLTSGELVIDRNLSLLGPGATSLAISGNGSSRVFFVTNGVTCTLAGLTITNGNGVGASPSGYGGGIFSKGTLTVSNCTLSGNSASLYGGGIYNNGGTLTVQHSTLSSNSAQEHAGAIDNIEKGTVIIQNSTITGNSTPNEGGGIHNHSSCDLRLTNTTVSANSALLGGGLYNTDGALAVNHSTLSGNMASAGGGLYQVGASATLTIGHTLLARGANGNNFTNVAGSVTNRGFNLANDSSANAFATQFANLLLGPLADNGGPTPTHALLLGSPALNAGTNIAMAGLPNDQRGSGYLRLYGARVDIGAYEAQPPLLVCPGDLPTTNTPGQCDAVVAFTASSDSPVNCVPASGLLFPAGTNLVLCTASNAFGTTQCSFKITVLDAQAPDITCPASFTATAPFGSNSAPVSFAVSATDNCGVAFTNCSPPSGSHFPIGASLVTCTAQDAAGNSSTCTFTVTVNATPCLSEITVVNTANAGPGSLRQAVADVCPGGLITFDPALNGQTLVLTSGELVIDRSLTILGPGAANLAISGNGSSRVFFITNDVACTLAGLTIINGRAPGGGFPGGYGGGIHNQGVLTMSNITLSGNWARVSGGGIFNGDDGTLTVQNSLLSTNSTDASGGGLLNKTGTALVQNSTLSGNSAENSGGGIFNNKGKLTVLNSTFSGNSATNGAASLAQDGANAALTIGHTLLARGASGYNFTNDSGSVTNLGLNLADDASANAFATPFANLQLGPLAFNGGPTPTHALLPGSPAIDAGTNAAIAGLPHDSRGTGYPRRVNGRVDVGAFEVQAPLFFTHIAPVPAGILLRVQGATNELLQLQWNITPGPGDWQPLTSGATDATGVLQHTNTGISGQPMRFYRAVRP